MPPSPELNHGVKYTLSNGRLCLNDINKAALVRVKRLFIGFLLGFLVQIPAFASGGGLVFDVMDVERGLSQSTVNTMLQDSRGFVWVATQAGLQRFDGIRLVNVLDAAENEFTRRVTTRYFTTLVEDHKRRLWIGTNSEGFLLFDIPSGKFIALPDAMASLSGQQAAIRAFVISEAKVWIATDAGLLLGEFADVAQTQIQLFNLGSKGQQINAMISDGRGGVYVATRDSGLMQVYADGSERRIAASSLPSNISSLYLQNNVLWIGSIRGAFFLDTEHLNAVSPLEHPILRDGNILTITGNDVGDLWFSVQNNGLVSYAQSTKAFNHLVAHSSDPYSLPDMWVRSLMIDDRGLLWVGTALRGFARAYSAKDRFRVFREYTNTGDESLRNHIRSIYQDAKRQVWLGMDGGGLKIWDENTQQYHYHTNTLRKALLKEQQQIPFRVQNIKTNDEKTFYLASNLGLLRYELGAHPTAQRFKSGILGSENSDVRSLWLDKDGTLWVGTLRGLFKVSEWDAEPEHVHAANGLTHDVVLSIFRDSFGQLWVGTINGLNRLDSSGRWQPFKHSDEISQTLCGNVVRDINQDSAGSILIATHSGLSIVKQPQNTDLQFDCYSRANGFIDNTIYAVREDRLGILWMSTNRGIIRFDRRNQSSTSYDRFDGLQSSEFNGASAFKNAEGELFFGGVRGFNRFMPESVQPSETEIPVHITSYQVGSEKEKFVLGENVDHITFDFEERVLAIQYAGLDYIAPHRISYRYRLDGFDNNWIPAGNRREITYSNLPAGHYQLHIMSTNHDGMWSTKNLKIPVNVLAPWWWDSRSKFAYALFVLCVAGWWLYASMQRNRERAMAAEAIRINEERLKWALWGSGDALWDWRVDSGELHRSGLDRLLGVPSSELNDSIEWLEKHMHPDDAPRALAALKRHLSGETESFETEYRLQDAKEQWLWILDRGRVVERDDAGRPMRMAGTMKDISDKRRQEEELRQLASYDTLTNLPNRTLFSERLRHSIAHARRNQQRVALLFLDLDRFKQINDSMGHAAGDLLLKQMANRLRSCVREEDSVARLGGDEFTVMLEEVHSIESVGIVANKIIKACELPFDLANNEVVVSPSIGISIFPDDGEDSTTLLKNADMAMYHAKEQGRNNFQFFVSSMNETMRRRITLETALRKAIERDEFTLHFQPKMNISNGDLTGMEALLRWRSADLGAVPPDEFISVAEDTGLIIPIGDWVLDAAVRQIADWRDQGIVPILPIAVNLSIRQLMHGDLANRIQLILDSYQVDASLISLELTETLVMSNAAQAVGRLNALRDMGLGLAVDDFGTGYSSLSYLRRLPIDTIKIDKAFVRDITVDEDDATIIRTIIAMAHSLKLKVVAEGVETNEQLHFLRENGCEEMQGYWLSRPVPAVQFVEMLKKHG